jgi:phage recombination protein Bet
VTHAIERAKPEASRLALATGMTDDRINLVAQLVAPGANRLELANFLAFCVARGLDPLAKQAYFIRYQRNQPGSIVVGIDGERATADSTGEYAGSDEPVFEYAEIEDPPPHGGPTYCKVTAYRIVQGQKVSAVGEARWVEEYPDYGKKEASGQGAQYRRRPWNQLAVRAESRALRKLFPRQMSQLSAPAKTPHTWQQAAEEDERVRYSAESVARNARMYDRIFGDDDDGSPPPVVDAEPLPPAPEAEETDEQLLDLAEVDRQRREEGLK